MNQDIELHQIILPIWLLTLSIPLILIIILVVISTGLVYLYKKIFKKDIIPFEQRIAQKLKSKSKIKRDFYRKINHILIFLGLVIIWIIGVYIVKSYTGTTLGMIPEENNMLMLYFKILNKPESIKEVLFLLGWFYYLLFFFFYTFCLFMLTNEFTRKSKYISFPFTIFPKFFLSEREEKSYGTYLYFTIGQMFVSFTCPPMVFFSILGMSSISDLMTSQVGIRFGKKQVSWNENKTWEGTIAGIIASVIICYIFMGLYWAIIFSFVFFSCDVLTNKPIRMSDNLLIPIGSSLVYLIIRFFFNLNYSTIILNWI
ncbi:MAG: hypothetical protein ACFE9T_02725 [Promethearchaeota archaeon]